MDSPSVSTFKSKIDFFERFCKQETPETPEPAQQKETQETVQEKTFPNQRSSNDSSIDNVHDNSALLILSDEIYIFENETDANEAAIRATERHNSLSKEEQEESCEQWTCPFIVKVADVNPTEYNKMLKGKDEEYS